jgi:hypothetical protein
VPKFDLNISYHPGQFEIFFGHKAKRKYVPKGRRFGLTRGYANFVVEKLAEGVSPILWVDTVQGNIEKYYQRYISPILKPIPAGYHHWDPKSKELRLFDRIVDFRSAERPELIEGFAYRLILLNEAGIILRDRYLWENTLQPMMLDYDPDVIVGGTPKGGGLFEELVAKAKDDPRSWTKTYTTYDNPLLQRGEIDKLAADLPEHVRQQEIYGQFVSDKGSVFRFLKESLDRTLQPKPHWEPNRKYFMGVDLAKHVDWTVIIVIDDLGRMVHLNRFNKLDWEYQQQVIIETAKAYKAKVLLDSTGVGDPIFDALKNKGMTLDGYKFTSDSKKKLIEGLMLAFEMKKLKLFEAPIPFADALFDELRLFGYEISATGTLRYGAPEGFHDDCVVALALAWMCKENMAPRSVFMFSEQSIY